MAEQFSEPFFRRTSLIGILLLCVLVRLAVLIGYPLDPAMETATPDEWDAVARNLAQGRGYTVYAPQAGVYDWDITRTTPEHRPTMRVPPVYPFTLAVLYRTMADAVLIGQLAQILFDTLTAWVIYRLGCLLFDRRAGLMAALGWALYVPEMTQTLRLRSEPLFTLLLALWVWSVLIVFSEKKGNGTDTPPSISGFRLLIPSLLLPLTVLCRPSMLGFGLLWVIHAIFRHRTFIPITGFGLILSPWIIRGFILFGEMVPIASNGGYSLYRSVHAIGGPDYITTQEVDFEAAHFAFRQTMEGRGAPLPQNEAQLDRMFRDRAFELIRDYPARYAHLCFENAFRLWFRLYGGTFRTWKDGLTCLINMGFIVLAVMGVKRHGVKSGFILLAITGYNTLFYALTLGDPRYNLPVIPLILLWSARR